MQKQQYRLLILNMLLIFVILLLIFLNFYKLALIGFGYLLIHNNLFIKEKFDDYVIQNHRFTNYYKKRFPVLYYVLPSIGIFSSLGMFYTGYFLNNMSQDMLSLLVHHQEVEFFQLLFTVFYTFFVFYVIMDVLIAIYVIKNANAPINPN